MTAAAAAELVADSPPDELLWVGDDAPPGVTATRARSVRKLLGASFDAVVLDLHTGLNADVLGQSHGFVRGGGAMFLRLPAGGDPPVAGQERFAAYPYTAEDVGNRFWQRFVRVVLSHASAPKPLGPIDRELHGTAEQTEVSDQIAQALLSDEPQRITLLADRGRGKSAALGIALRRAHAARPDLRCVVASGSEDAVREVFRFANEDGETDAEWLQFRRIADFVRKPEPCDVVVVDEAAQLPVPLLRRLVREHGDVHFAFATTTHGYEGTGRGFSLRFVDWLRRRAELIELSLSEPIRWAAGDPLEAAVFDALLLDAELAEIDASFGPADVRHVMLERDELARDEALLRGFFGLLVHAHYRTTPGDLHRMLDAPNLDLHALLHGDDVVGASLVAREGGWSEDICERIHAGAERARGHALPETLVAHLGHRDAGRLDMVRSVRIAVHPAVRRLALGTTLVEAVESCYSPDLFGTLFGATPELLAFRRACGYEPVRLSASRGRRSGEPSVAMVKPASPAAARLVGGLRAEFARDLPLQLRLLTADGDLVLEQGLADALEEGLPEPAAADAAWVDETVRHYIDGPRTFESVALAIRHYVERYSAVVSQIDAQDRILLQARAFELVSWKDAADAAGFESVPAAMRAMRRAVRDVVTRVADRGSGAADFDAGGT